MRKGVRAGCISLAAATVAVLAGCGGDGNANLKEAYQDYFPIGTAIAWSNYEYYDQAGLFADFSSVSFENATKWESVEPNENRFTFSEADELAEFAKSKGMLIRGHTILWHSQTPSYVFTETDAQGNKVSASIETLKARIKNHVDNVVGHFKDDISCWDVANEVISDAGYFYRDYEDGTNDKQSDWYRCVREDVLKNLLGDAFDPAIGNEGEQRNGNEAYRRLTGEERDSVNEAFTDLLAFTYDAVYQADPDCELFYNDYNLTIPAKRDKCIEMIGAINSRLEEMGSEARITAVGEQAHYNIYQFDGDLLRQAIEAYAAAGLDFQITELDVSFYSSTAQQGTSTPPEDKLEMQTQVYEEIFRICREYKDNVSGITLWGVADDYTWLDTYVTGRKDWPLLYDELWAPKACYEAILNF